MKTIFWTVSAGSLLAAGLLMACADDETHFVYADGVDAEADTAPQNDAGVIVEEDAASDAAPDADAGPPRPAFDASAPNVECEVTPCITSITGGPQNFCATTNEGEIYCWGSPWQFSAFTDTSAANAGATPFLVTGLGDIQDLQIGSSQSCFVTSGGEVKCFGQSSPTPQTPPEIVTPITNAKKVSIGESGRTCAVLGSGQVQCWGDSWFGVGAGETIYSDLPEPAMAVLSRMAMGFIVETSGKLLSWGSERYALGRSTTLNPDLTPAPVMDLPPVLQVAAGDQQACAIATDGRLFCWGRNDYGSLGIGQITHQFRPLELYYAGQAWPTQVLLEQFHGCTRMGDGTVHCWGSYNTYGVVGPQYDGTYVPTKVQGLAKAAVSIALGGENTCALLVDGSVQCWGRNDVGQLGLGTADNLRHPVPATVVFPSSEGARQQ